MSKPTILICERSRSRFVYTAASGARFPSACACTASRRSFAIGENAGGSARPSAATAALVPPLCSRLTSAVPPPGDRTRVDDDREQRAAEHHEEQVPEHEHERASRVGAVDSFHHLEPGADN